MADADRLEHPRAREEGAEAPPQVATDAGRVAVDDDGYFAVSEASEAWVTRFATAHGVTYGPDGAIEREDEPPDPAETWGEWSEEEWLDADYEQRADAVLSGGVDPYLGEIEDVETSSTVEEAVEERREALRAED